MYRPAGTDGSDFSYRQTIDHKYKLLSGLRSTAGFLANGQVIAVAVFISWHVLIHYLEGSATSPALWFSSASLASCLLWWLGRPGGSRESLFLLSAASMACLTAVLMCLYVSRGSIMASLTDDRNLDGVKKYVDKSFGALLADVDLNAALLVLEGLVDVITMIVTSIATYYQMRYISARWAALHQVRNSKHR